MNSELRCLSEAELQRHFGELAVAVCRKASIETDCHVLLLSSEGSARASSALCWRASRSRTSLSVVCEKSSYDCPTAKNGSGKMTLMTSSASLFSASQVSGEA